MRAAQLQDQMEAVIRGFDLLKPDKKLAQYFPDKDNSLDEIIETYRLIVERTEQTLEQLKHKDLNRILLEQLYTYLQTVVLAQLTTKVNANESYAQVVMRNDARLLYILMAIDNCKQLDDDIAVLRERHPNYHHLLPLIRKIYPKDKTSIAKNYTAYEEELIVSYASAVAAEHSKNKTSTFGLSKPKYKLATTQASIVVYDYFRRPIIEVVKRVWNLADREQLSNVDLDYISINEKLYLPRVQLPPETKINLFQASPDKTCVRLLCDKSIKFRYQQPANLCCVARPKFESYDRIIVHLHGGGFISLSSKSAQVYTRRWATELRVPVFSIEYRLVPEDSFPTLLEDCYSSYLFLLQNLSNHMNIKPKKVILVGDGAGGNLAIALTGLLIKNKKQLPDTVVLVYPEADLREDFSPSRLQALNSCQLFPSLMLLCHKAYCGQQIDNPWTSPILLTEDTVNDTAVEDLRWPLNWPRTRIFVGELDPYYDDSLRLLQQLALNKVDCRMTVFEGLGHGFMELESKIPQCSGAVRQIIRSMDKLLDQ